MSCFNGFERNLRSMKISPFVEDIPALREYPLVCDPRRLRSSELLCDIERSREEQPLFELSTDPYKVRRVVVPRTRLQYAQVSRIPNARDPRGVKACKRSSIVKKCPQAWTPTLVENDEVPCEEETCAVLVIDVSDWESTATKSCYIQIIPHECNVERAVLEKMEADNRLPRPDDGLLMSAEEAEQRMEAGRNERVLDDSDVQECDSDGDVLPQDSSAGFDNVEDRPMLQEDEQPVTISLDASIDAESPSPRRQIDDDEDEDRVIYMPEEKPVLRPVPRVDDADIECVEIDVDEPVVPIKKEEPQAPPPVPNPDDADIVCIDLDSGDDESDQPIMPKEELRDAHVRAFDKNIQREVLAVVTLDDSEEESSMLGAMSISGEEEENSTSKLGDGCSSGRASASVVINEDFLEEQISFQSSEQIIENKSADELGAVVTSEDFLEESVNFQNSAKVIEDKSASELGAIVTSVDFLENPLDTRYNAKIIEDNSAGELDTEPEMREAETIEYGPQQNVQFSFGEIEKDLRLNKCDREKAIIAEIRDIVIGLTSTGKNRKDAWSVEKSTSSAMFVAAIPDTRDIADEAYSSSDRDSNVPTAMQLDAAPGEMHVSAVHDETNDFIVGHSKITKELAERGKVVAHLVNTSEMISDITHLRGARRKKRKRFDSADAETLSDDDIAVNDENRNNNCYAIVNRVPSPVFSSPRKKKRSKKKPNGNVLQLSNISTCANAGSRRPILIGNFFAFGTLCEYLKSYSATFNSLNFLCKNYENVSVYEFLRINDYVKNNNAFWQDWTDRNHGHQQENIPSNQIAVTEYQSASSSNEEEIVAPLQNFSAESSAVEVESNQIERSWFAKGENDVDSDQRRHSLPMVIIPSQNLGGKRPLITSPTNKESNNDALKLTLKRSEGDDRAWFALIPNKTCNQMNRELPKWSCINKEVPELDIDDFKDRPIPQKIECKFSINLQKRPKKRTISVDSAIASDFDDFSCKRQKVVDFTKDRTCTLNDSDHEFSFNEYNREPLEITELSSDSCIDSRPSSANICNVNNDNNVVIEDKCTSMECTECLDEKSENSKSCSLENLPKNHHVDTASLSDACVTLSENSALCQENVNSYLSDGASGSSSSFHLEMEDSNSSFCLQIDEDPEDQLNTKDGESNIPVDYNSNHQKDSNSFDESCSDSSITHQDERNLIDGLEKTEDSNSDKNFIRRVDRVHKKIKLLFGDDNIDEVKEMVAVKYQADRIICTQKDTQSCSLKESEFGSITEKQSTINALESKCAKDSSPASNCSESGLIDTTAHSKKPEQQFSSSRPTITNDTERLGHDFQDQNKQQENNEKILLDDTLDAANITNAEHSNRNCNIEESEHVFQNQSTQQDNNETILPGDTLNAANSTKSENSNTDCNVERLRHDQNKSEQQENSEKISSNATLDVANRTDIEHSSEGKQILEDNEHLENQEIQDTSNSSSSHELNGDPETASLSDDLEEGDFDFLASIQRNRTDHKYDDDDYDIDSDCDEYESRTSFEYSSGNNFQKLNEGLDCIGNTNISNSNVFPTDDQSSQTEVEQVEENLCNLLSSPQPSLETTSSVAEKSNSSDIMNTVEGDDDIIIEYEKISNHDNSKEVPDISNVNNSLNLQTCKLFGLHYTELNIHEEKSLEGQSREEASVSDNTSVDCIPNEPSPTSTIQTPASNGCNDEVPDDRTLVNSTIAESTIELEGKVKFDLNNADILQKYNLFKEIVAPEDIKTENLTTCEDTNEEQSLLNKYLDNMLQDEPGEECNISTETTTEENLDVHAEVPSSTKLIESYMPTSRNLTNQTLMKALNVNFDDQVDIIIESTPGESTSKNLSSGTIKVKNLNDMLKKRPDSSEENVSSNHVSLSNLPSNSSKQSQHNIPVNTCTADHSISNANISKSSPCLYVISQPTPARLVQSHMNVCNSLPVNISCTNNASGKYTLISAPVNNTQIDALTNYTMVAAPVNNTQVDVPTNYTVVAAPVNSTQIDTPTNYTLVTAPVNSTQVDVPTNYTVVAAPVNSTQIDTPTNYTLVAAPVNNTQIAVPANNTQIAAPVNKAQIGAPVHNIQIAAPVNNEQVSTSPPTAPDNPIVTASSMFSGMFDSNGTSSFCSKTVFSLPLPPLKNIMLPPPYTLLATYDKQTISFKIESYKWQLLNKIIVTLTELENMDTQMMKKHFTILYQNQTLTEETWNFQERLLIIAQCVFSLWKLSTNNNYISIIEAIMASIKHQVRDANLLKKIFEIFQKLKERGIFTSYAVERQPLTSELGILMKQVPIGMSSNHKEVLKIQIKIYQEMRRINNRQLPRSRMRQSNNQTNDQIPVQRSSPMQQSIITPVSSPVTTTRNNKNSSGILQEQGKEAKQCQSVKRNIKGFLSKCDNVDENRIKCGKKSQIVCSKCKVTTYCSHHCQKIHWENEHYASCDLVNS